MQQAKEERNKIIEKENKKKEEEQNSKDDEENYKTEEKTEMDKKRADSFSTSPPIKNNQYDKFLLQNNAKT